MAAPRFWFTSPQRPGAMARLLTPLGLLYALATRRRVARAPGLVADIPVICVGNLNVGGTGKTPTVIALREILAARGVAAHILSRGHGGRLTGPIEVSERDHSAEDVGDEPLLLSAFARTWVARDRAAGARMAIEAGAQAILMDDGFQNPALAKSLSLIVVDAAFGFGNGRCLPAGPLREPIEAGMARCDLVLSIGPDAAQESFARNWGKSIPVPHFTGRLAPLPTGMDWAGMRVMAFAGIGRPQKFFATLRDIGVDLAGTQALEDHQPYSSALLKRLETEAAQLGAQLVTTEKDAVRLPPAFRPKVLTLPVRLEIADTRPLIAALERIGL